MSAHIPQPLLWELTRMSALLAIIGLRGGSGLTGVNEQVTEAHTPLSDELAVVSSSLPTH